MQAKALGPSPVAQLEKMGLYHLRAVDAFFDDKDHFHHIKNSCGLTHPQLTEATSSQLNIRTMEDLKRVIKTRLGLSFCDLCLEFRQVFVSEQGLYSKAKLDEHNKKGDVGGTLSQTNFKGHPACKCAPMNRVYVQ